VSKGLNSFLCVNGLLTGVLLMDLVSDDVAVNSENYPGAIGFQTRLLPWVYPVTLIRVNEETGEPIRDDRGLCSRCEPGQL